MSILDEVTKKKLQVSEALARLDTQREKLVGELGELEATERVLARYSKGQNAKKPTSTPAAAPNLPAPARQRGRRTTVTPAGGKRTPPTLGERVLALADGRTQQEIAAACKGARPNHVGGVIARHKRAGRIELRDGKLYATHSGGGATRPV